METFFGLVFTFGIIALIVWLIAKFIGKSANRINENNSNNLFIKKYLDTCSDFNIRKEIETALEDNINKLPIQLFLTKNYLFYKKAGSVQFIPLSSIVWLYARDINYKTNIGNNMGEYHCLMVTVDGNKTIKIGINRENSEYVVKSISEKCSWATVGYSKELEEDIKHNFMKYQSKKDNLYKENISKNL